MANRPRSQTYICPPPRTSSVDVTARHRSLSVPGIQIPVTHAITTPVRTSSLFADTTKSTSLPPAYTPSPTTITHTRNFSIPNGPPEIRVVHHATSVPSLLNTYDNVNNNNNNNGGRPVRESRSSGNLNSTMVNHNNNNSNNPYSSGSVSPMSSSTSEFIPTPATSRRSTPGPPTVHPPLPDNPHIFSTSYVVEPRRSSLAVPPSPMQLHPQQQTSMVPNAPPITIPPRTFSLHDIPDDERVASASPPPPYSLPSPQNHTYRARVFSLFSTSSNAPARLCEHEHATGGVHIRDDEENGVRTVVSNGMTMDQYKSARKRRKYYILACAAGILIVLAVAISQLYGVWNGDKK